MRSCQEVCKKKSGGSLPGTFLDSYSVDVLRSVMHLLQQLRGGQSPEPLLGDQQQLPEDRGGGVLLSLAGVQPGGLFSYPRGYTAFLLFTHLSNIPHWCQVHKPKILLNL